MYPNVCPGVALPTFPRDPALAPAEIELKSKDVPLVFDPSITGLAHEVAAVSYTHLTLPTKA